jgi:pimeloyl-ACP methyl ester carboxylesterase
VARIRDSIVASVFTLAVSLVAAACSAGSQPTEDASTSKAARDKASCDALNGAKVSGTLVDSAKYVEAGSSYVDTGIGAALRAPRDFCRVAITLASEPGSIIKAEVWLPDAWNGNFYGAGGGGFSGGLDTAPLGLADAIAQGYASAASDAGHKTSDGAAWSLNEPIKIADWANRANHVTAVFGKALVRHYYGTPPERSYFQGCSNGGRDALMMAQRYPDEFDGIISGAPAANWTGLMSSFVANDMSYKAFGPSGQDAKFKIAHDAVMAKCDTIDGVKDGVLENPRACAFDPAEVMCKPGTTSTCLSKDEVDALRTIYQGHRLEDGRPVFAGFSVGGEADRSGWRDPSKAGTAQQFGYEFFRYMVYKDPTWSADTFELDRDNATAVERMAAITNANNPDISAFTRRGGKLILWHGWNDSLIQAEGTISYYEAVEAKLGPATDQHVKLFMAPGVNHCYLGAGPSFFDMISELDRWVETGEAPKRVIATKYDNDVGKLLGLPAKPVRTRPLCPWPQTARYTGSGSTDEAANFVCKAD